MNPNEIFTYPTDNITEEALKTRTTYHCKFLGRKCDKQSRMIDYPMGICSVNFNHHKPIICPHRFLEDNLVFSEASMDIFGTIDNVIVFSEVKIPKVGNFDFVLVKHKPLSNKIEDFCVVEFQSDSTTATGELVKSMKDFMANDFFPDKKYRFGMNTYNTIKLSYIQMLIKGQVMEKWGKHIIWVMQDFVFSNMVNRFGLIDLEYDFEKKNKYHLYDLNEKEGEYKLTSTQKYSTSVANLLKAFTHQPTPNIDTFIKVLDERIKLKLGIHLG